MEAGTGGSIRRLTSALEGFQIAMGNVLSRAFSPVIEGATDLLNRIEPLTEEFKGVIGPVVKTASAILALGLAAKGAGVAVWTIKALASPFALMSRMASGLATSAAAARVQLMATARPITLLTIASRGAVATGTAHIAMNRALGISLNGVAVAARTAGTAIGTFIKANWIGLLVAGLVALYSWYQSKLAKVQAEIERTADAMKQAADVAKKALDARYDENKGAWDKFGSLQQLEKLSTMRDLTEDEIKQVKALKAELAGFGSGAFAFVDDGAKSFRLAADATERMTVAMRENATKGLEAQKAAVLKQIEMIEKRAKAEIDNKEAPMSVGMALQGRGTMDTWKQRGVKDALVWERGEYALLQASLMRVNKQLDEMKNAPVVDTIGGVFGEDAAARVAMTAEQIAELEKATKSAVEEMAKLFTEAQRQGMTPVQREIEEVGDLEKKFRDAAKIKRDFLLAGGGLPLRVATPARSPAWSARSMHWTRSRRDSRPCWTLAAPRQRPKARRATTTSSTLQVATTRQSAPRRLATVRSTRWWSKAPSAISMLSWARCAEAYPGCVRNTRGSTPPPHRPRARLAPCCRRTSRPRLTR